MQGWPSPSSFTPPRPAGIEWEGCRAGLHLPQGVLTLTLTLTLIGRAHLPRERVRILVDEGDIASLGGLQGPRLLLSTACRTAPQPPWGVARGGRVASCLCLLKVLRVLAWFMMAMYSSLVMVTTSPLRVRARAP
jgi:hypothetical protein